MLCAAAFSTMTTTGASGQAGSQSSSQSGARTASKTAVIPTETIYPGQTIEETHLQVVAVTNPDLSGDYASGLDQVVGKVTNRTLLAGRVIFVAGLREPYAVERGKAVRIVYSNGSLTITAGGSPLDNASVGDLIRIRNTDSGMIVSGTVMADGTVHVVAK
ncbi:flagellar basal body P-ring formation protein FlgA [Rhizobiaceae bacterium CRRU44]|uniref:Flagella basal body P-ring formation protein FlgA n=2 Tax=Ferranicluibacter rubi TaxID=2715133 RepID=A0AA43ZB62_9HYPH|nr:flagellar basal body P-ring formation protein FlgA [Ferranicluibacter rubi]